jgi:hypothetical protein
MLKIMLTTPPDEIISTLRDLSQQWHELDAMVNQRLEANDYGERTTDYMIALDDVRFQIMEIVLAL